MSKDPHKGKEPDGEELGIDGKKNNTDVQACTHTHSTTKLGKELEGSVPNA